MSKETRQADSDRVDIQTAASVCGGPNYSSSRNTLHSECMYNSQRRHASLLSNSRDRAFYIGSRFTLQPILFPKCIFAHHTDKEMTTNHCTKQDVILIFISFPTFRESKQNNRCVTTRLCVSKFSNVGNRRQLPFPNNNLTIIEYL